MPAMNLPRSDSPPIPYLSGSTQGVLFLLHPRRKSTVAKFCGFKFPKVSEVSPRLDMNKELGDVVSYFVLATTLYKNFQVGSQVAADRCKGTRIRPCRNRSYPPGHPHRVWPHWNGGGAVSLTRLSPPGPTLSSILMLLRGRLTGKRTLDSCCNLPPAPPTCVFPDG